MRMGARRIVLVSESAALVVAMMLLGSIALWIAMPAGWLWVGSRLQAETGSVGVALIAMFAGIVSSTALIVSVLTRLNRRHVELRAARGCDLRGPTALERVLVASGLLALLAFVAWFVVFSSASPFPGLELTY
jgi:uncharacterized membrane protein YbhN (UPF0104 family)